jgi:hypothetical protein
MKLLKNLVALTFAVALPVFAQAIIPFEENSLGANKVIPNKLVESVMTLEQAEKFLSKSYTGFYQLQGKVTNNKLRFEKVKQKVSYPDASLEALALGLAGMIEIPVYTTGSRIKSRATAYMAFYEGTPAEYGIENAVTVPTSVDGEPNTTVLLIIKQKETSAARNANMRLANAEAGKRDGSQAYFFQLAI